jgi:hypothetical protein
MSVVQWWKKNFLFAEMLLAIALALFFAAWVEWRGSDIVDSTLKGNRGAVYGAIATIFGSLLGFVITSVSIVLSVSGDERLSLVRNSASYPVLWKVFTACIRSLSLATVVAMFGLILDRDGAPNHIVLYFCVGTGILAVFRIARCVWVLENIVKIVSARRAAS